MNARYGCVLLPRAGPYVSENRNLLNKIICLFWQTNIPLSGSHLDEAVSSACQFQLLVNRLQLEAEESKLISSLTLDVVPPLGPHDLHRPCVILYLVHGRLPIHFFL